MREGKEKYWLRATEIESKKHRNIMKVHDLMEDMNATGKQDNIESSLFHIGYKMVWCPSICNCSIMTSVVIDMQQGDNST